MVLVAGSGAFLLAKFSGADGQATARPPAAAEAQVPTLATGTRAANFRPDTSKPFWYVPYLDEDRAKPRFDQTVNAVLVGPTVRQADPIECTATAFARAVLPAEVAAAVAGTRFAATPSYLPPLATLESDEVVACGDIVVARQRRYRIPADEAAVGRVTRGEASWFDIRHGGAIDIWLVATPEPRMDSEAASDRWRPLERRQFAAVAPAVFDELGRSTLIAWDNGVLVRIEGTDLETSDLIAIEEGLR